MISYAIQYAIFVAIAAFAYYAMAPRHRWLVLVATGTAALALVGPLHLAVAAVFVFVNFASALLIARWLDTRRATITLVVTIVFDVFVLATFKYGNALLSLDLVLPLGISYYAFQVIGYNLEVYWGRADVEPHLGRFASSILFFPKLAAGPIERPHRFLAQLDQNKRTTSIDVIAGLRQIGWGVFKKCVVADRLGMVIDPIYSAPHEHAGVALMAVIVLYPIQIYNDFSGYTDVALGSARLFGIELTPNFNHPFSATSVSEFWRRWHMSLTSWTTDYVYKPLSLYMRNSRAGLVAATLITFVVLGLWHGDRLNFVLFGLMHGVAVAVESALPRRGREAPRLPPRVANALTFAFYSLTCVFFRASRPSDAIAIIHRAFTTVTARSGIRDVVHSQDLAVLAAVALATIAARRAMGTRTLAETPAWLRWSIHYAIACAIVVLGVLQADRFVYAQF